jgi:hypothetical protein
MSDAQSAVSAAIFTALTTNSELAALIGANGIHDRLLNKAAMPYVLIREISSTEWGADNDGGLEHQIVIEAWSSKAGHAEAQAMAGLIRSSLNNQALSLTGFTLVNLTHTKTRTRREAKTDAHVAEMAFRAVTVGP